MPSCFTCNNLFLSFMMEQAKPLPGLSTTALPHPEFLHGSSSGSRPGQLATPDILPHSLLLATHQVVLENHDILVWIRIRGSMQQVFLLITF
jgi:hypothetical protein